MNSWKLMKTVDIGLLLVSKVYMPLLKAWWRMKMEKIELGLAIFMVKWNKHISGD